MSKTNQDNNFDEATQARADNIIDFLSRLKPGPQPFPPDPQVARAMAELAEIARPKAKQPLPGTVGAERVKFEATGDDPEPVRLSRRREKALSISDFIAHSPDHSYIYRPTGEPWTSTAVNSRVKPVPIGGGKKALPANVWLDRNDAVEQRTWAPGEPQVVRDRLVAEGGFFPK